MIKFTAVTNANGNKSVKFVLLNDACGWVWSSDGMILTGKKPIPVFLYQHKFHMNLPRLNLILPCEMPASNCLSHGMAKINIPPPHTHIQMILLKTYGMFTVHMQTAHNEALYKFKTVKLGEFKQYSQVHICRTYHNMATTFEKEIVLNWWLCTAHPWCMMA